MKIVQKRKTGQERHQKGYLESGSGDLVSPCALNQRPDSSGNPSEDIIWIHYGLNQVEPSYRFISLKLFYPNEILR